MLRKCSLKRHNLLALKIERYSSQNQLFFDVFTIPVQFLIVLLMIFLSLNSWYSLLFIQTQELVIPGYNESLQAYMQWRPVVYTSRTRDLSSSTDVNISSPVQVHKPSVEMKDTILYAMYGEDLNDMLVTRLNVTLGGVSDGFYKKTKYQAW